MKKTTKHDKNQPMDKVIQGPAFSIKEYNVVSWSPSPAGSNGPCTQVHMLFNLDVDGLDATFAFRFKRRREVDEMIEALIEHRDHVWPKASKGQKGNESTTE